MAIWNSPGLIILLCVNSFPWSFHLFIIRLLTSHGTSMKIIIPLCEKYFIMVVHLIIICSSVAIWNSPK